LPAEAQVEKKMFCVFRGELARLHRTDSSQTVFAEKKFSAFQEQLATIFADFAD
jgi:hypothetical protein